MTDDLFDTREPAGVAPDGFDADVILRGRPAAAQSLAEDVANAPVFLRCDEARFMGGGALNLDAANCANGS